MTQKLTCQNPQRNKTPDRKAPYNPITMMISYAQLHLANQTTSDKLCLQFVLSYFYPIIDWFIVQ